MGDIHITASGSSYNATGATSTGGTDGADWIQNPLHPNGLYFPDGTPLKNIEAAAYWATRDYISVLGGIEAHTVYINGKLYQNSNAELEAIQTVLAERTAIENLQIQQAHIEAKAGFLGSDTAQWESQIAYNIEAQELPAEIDAFNADLNTFLSGQTAQPAGTGSQPAGTQPDKEAGLNPLIPVAAFAFVAVAAVALARGKS